MAVTQEAVTCISRATIFYLPNIKRRFYDPNQVHETLDNWTSGWLLENFMLSIYIAQLIIDSIS
jgi:hypothetical protein